MHTRMHARMHARTHDSPWDQPIVLSRAWCLYELYVAILAKAPVQMCFSPDDERRFFEALRAGLFDAKAVCSTADAMRATATVLDDKAMITDRIKMLEGGLEGGPQAAIALLRETIADAETAVSSQSPRSSFCTLALVNL